MHHPYRGVHIALSTMHGKEQILGPLFQEIFNAKVLVPQDMNTDIFGTFSGEVPRKKDIKDVLRKKADLGMRISGHKYGIASEGSFGPHPWIPFASCNQEFLIFKDLERDIEVFSTGISLNSRADSIQIQKLSEAQDFFRKIGFGSQGVIVRPPENLKNCEKYIFKGLREFRDVESAFLQIKRDLNVQKIVIETDNRCHMSPRRQKVIFNSGQLLVETLCSLCPECGVPGFEMFDYLRGLPCSECGKRSDKPQKELWRCPSKNCTYQEERGRLDGLQSLDPSECDECNP